MTLTDAGQSGRILIWHCGCRSSLWTGTFAEPSGALGALRGLTALGREYWARHKPSACAMGANLNFEPIVVRVADRAGVYMPGR